MPNASHQAVLLCSCVARKIRTDEFQSFYSLIRWTESFAFYARGRMVSDAESNIKYSRVNWPKWYYFLGDDLKIRLTEEKNRWNTSFNQLFTIK